MKLNVDDAVRYMGAGKGNAEIREMTAGIAEELEKAVKPRFTWRTFHIEQQEGGVLFREAGEILPGKLAVNMHRRRYRCPQPFRRQARQTTADAR